MNTQTRATVFGEVLGELMRSRGIPEEPEQIVELAEKSGLDPTALLARMSGEADDAGDLDGLAEELTLSRGEMRLLAKAYTYEEGRPGDVVAGLFERIIPHLDFVASLDETEHGGSEVARHIREALIPFCEVQEALARETEG